MSHAKLVEQLRQEYTNYLKKETEILDKHNHQLGQKIGHKEVGENIRNILLIGRTGNGKSTLANVLVNKNGKFEEVFKEGAGSTSETRDFKSEEFEENGIKYRVIDTMGFGSTSLKNLSQKHVLDKTKDLIFLLKEGVNQILFVSDGRFSKEEIEGYNYLKEIVFGEDISQYTTVVRTNSPEREIEKLYKDLKKIIRESEQIISCQDIIYVDNPPISASIDSDESEEDKRGIEAENGCSIEKRKESRRILLNHLEKCQKFCGLQSSKNLNLPFDKRKNEIQKKDSELEEKSEQINFLQFQVQELTDLIKKQKEKILEAYIYFAPEKELLQGLIKVHLEYSKAKKQKLPAIKIRKQRDKILNAIEDKLNKEEDMEEIEAILIDCEELVSQELELEAKLKGRSLLIEDGKQNPVLQIIDSSEERKNVELEKKELVVRHLEEKLKLKEEFQKREKELLDALIAVKNLVTEKEQIKDKLASKKEIQELKNQLQEENTSQQTISIKENNQVEAQQLEVPKMHWGENK